jgi:hypothetical protein
MADGNLSLGMLNDLLDLYKRIESSIVLTAEEKFEINEAVSKAVIKTESVFGKAKNRLVVQNDEVAEAWRIAGTTLIRYLPQEQLGGWLQNKGEAWANPEKWSPELLTQNNLQIEQIKKRVTAITGTRRKFLRPNNR